MVDIDFDDLLRYNETSHEVHREMDSSLSRYFGRPERAIDVAWVHLLQYEYPAVSSEEIILNPGLQFRQKDVHPLTGKHYIALDVFHNLHCLNAVRMELDKGYYGSHNHEHHIGGRVQPEHNSSHGVPKTLVEAAQRKHIDHCMNHIRQSLQCRPDLSPAAMHILTDTDGSQLFQGNAKRHTCYDWNSIVEWANARATDLGFATPIH